MSTFPAQAKTCHNCLGDLSPLHDQAMFTGQCAHSFHCICISPILFSGSPLCPVCRTPLTAASLPPPAFGYNPSAASLPPPAFGYNPFVFTPHPFRPYSPAYEPEPLHFCDDDPVSDSVASDARSGLAITGIAERPAVAAAESVPLFAVLVGLKASALSGSRADIDLVTVLDVSGSMCGTKLALVKSAVHFVIDNLGPSDRLSIVSFASQAKRILRLRRMSESGREEAKRAVDSLVANGGTNIVEGLKKGVQVLEERRQANPVSSIIFLSDGNDTCHHQSSRSVFWAASDSQREAPGYLHLLPASIRPRNGTFGLEAGLTRTIPVHSFGFGSDHDPVTMHAISDASGGTFSFIESYEVVQDAFAGCIGGLLSVVAQEVRLTVQSASHGVMINSIPSGRYKNEITNDGSQGVINVGDMYADEHKEFLINVSIPALSETEDNNDVLKTSLLDIRCSYKDVTSEEMMQVEGELVDICRPKTVSITDMMVNLAIDRQRNRIMAAEAIAEAQRMAETGNLVGARTLLQQKRVDVLASAAGQAGDGLSAWVEADMMETESRMQNQQVYQQAGRAYALSGMSSHGFQRAAMNGSGIGGVVSFGAAALSTPFAGYATPNMANMVMQSQQQRKTGDGVVKKE